MSEANRPETDRDLNRLIDRALEDLLDSLYTDTRGRWAEDVVEKALNQRVGYDVADAWHDWIVEGES